jgi:galactokinase
MYMMRESWTDERLDEFAKHVDFRFDVVDRRFDEVDRRIDEVDKKFDRRFDKVDHELHRVNDRLDAMGKVMIQAIVTMFGSTLVGFLALASLILTQH